MIDALTSPLIQSLAPRVGSLLSSSRTTKRLLAAASDLVACVFASWVAFGLRLGVLDVFTVPFLIFTVSAMMLVITVFLARGVYNNVFRFHGPKGLAQIALSSLIILSVLLVVYGLVSVPGVPRTVSVIFPAVFFIVIAVSRIVARFVLVEMLEKGEPPERVLIYGAGAAGRSLAASLLHERGYQLVAFADDDVSLAGQAIEGTRILVGKAVDETLAADEVDLVLLALPSLSRSERAAIVERLQAFGVHVQTLPGIHEIVAGEVSVSDLREIEIADLLARDQVVPDPDLLDLAIRGQTVLVTGAGGSIGSELCRQIILRGAAKLILFEMTEAALYAIDTEIRTLAAREEIRTVIIAELGTLADKDSVGRLFGRWQPDTVYHAAAYKHVPLVESNPIAGVGNNVLGTLHCAEAAIKAGTRRFILISTDKAVRPTNVMGASKRVCELVLQALAEKQGTPTVFAMVRFGNVLGSSGSVVPHFRRQIEEGGPVTLTHRDVTRFFMTIPEAAELVIQAGSMASGGEVYLLDMGEPVRIYDLARSMIQMSGRSVRDAQNPDGDIEIVEVGLRPGEKLYEELLIGAEAEATLHPRIFRARELSLEWDVLWPALEAIDATIRRADDQALRGLLAELVDGFEHAATSAQPATDAKMAKAAP